jgi:hypothetical protein
LLLPCQIDETLAGFLQVDTDTTLTRNEIRNAINVYIKYNVDETRPEIKRWEYLNPGGLRNLQDDHNHSIINPDSRLAELLNYGEYVEGVRNGNIKQRRKDKETGVDHWITVSNEELTYCVVQKLYQARIVKTLKPNDVKL